MSETGTTTTSRRLAPASALVGDALPRSASPGSRVRTAFLRNPAAMFGIVLLVLMVLLAALAPVIGPDGYDQQDLRGRLKPPLWENAAGQRAWLGTDSLGRDILVRIAYGARVSLVVAAVGLGIGGGLGALIGLLAGVAGGWIDTALMRLADAQLAMPSLLLSIAIIALLGANVWTLLLVLSLRTWVVIARPLRSAVLSIREHEFVLAATSLGASRARVAARHILPEAVAPLIVMTTAQLGALILLESTLSFLGLGIQPPAPSWGNMLSSGQPYMTVAWWVPAMPGLAILVAVLGTNLVGDGLRDALDPRLKA
ncbi:MAG: ABC transporter permease [Thermomicrobiales bacterium]|nr:ABC transporter permease [Thermomicrobiales bacterium]